MREIPICNTEKTKNSGGPTELDVTGERRIEENSEFGIGFLSSKWNSL